MLSFLHMILVVMITGLFSMMSISTFAEYDQQQKKTMNEEFEELSETNKNLSVDKQAETLGTHKVQDKLHDREVDIDRTSKSDMPRDQDRAGKTVEEKRDIHSDGPRADGHEDSPLETQEPVPLK